MSLAQWLREIRYMVEFLLVWPCVALIRWLDEARSRTLAHGLSRVFYRVLAFHRQWCLRNLELVFGDHLTASQRARLAMKTFENFALTAIESLRWTEEWMVSHVVEQQREEATQVALAARRQGKGCMMITVHLGNFELLPAWVHYRGWSSMVVYHSQKNWRIEQLIAGARKKYLRDAVPRGPGTFSLLKQRLLNGEGVGLLVDLNTARRGMFVDFLGFQADIPPGAAALALDTRCPVMLALSIRLPDGRHLLTSQPPFQLIDTGDRKRDIAANTEQYLKAVEPYILAYPEQFNWLHPYWRFRPDGSVWKLNMPQAAMAAERIGPPREPWAMHATQMLDKKANVECLSIVFSASET